MSDKDTPHYPSPSQNEEQSNDKEKDKDEIKLENVEGHMENEPFRPRFQVEVNETELLIKLKRLLHKEDFNNIFNPKNRNIGEIL